MDKPPPSRPAIWVVQSDPQEKASLYDRLPGYYRQGSRTMTLEQALGLLAGRVKPGLIFLEGRPDLAAQEALSQLNEAAPELPVFVINHWENAEAMRAWVSRCVLEAVRPSPLESLVSLNSYRLSTRELEVLRLIVRGLIKKEIAEGLAISYHTVDNHERSIFKKLNVHNRSAAVAKALIEKIV